MVRQGDSVICGLSGGADSVCLLSVLAGLSRTEEFRLFAVHVHHGIRGDEADRDEAFSMMTAERLGIPYQAVYEDVPRLAKTKGLSEEEAGREARRRAFSSFRTLLRERGVKGRIVTALAHHRDDAAETVLYQLSRGSGLAGFSGIRPKTGHTIRPLLCVSRAEIEAWMLKNEIPFITDSTNESDAYARNRIRHHVLPYLESEIHEGAAGHIAEAALIAGRVLDFMEEEAKRRTALYADHDPEENGCPVLLRNDAFSKEPQVMQEYMIRYCIRVVDPHGKDLSREHIAAILNLSSKPNGKRIDLPGGMRAERTYEGILFESAACPEGRGPGEIGVLRPGVSLDTESGRFEAAFVPSIPFPIPEKIYTKWIDFAIITDELRIRTRQPGDFITINAEGGRKSISDFMTDAKIPRKERDTMLLAADGKEIVWIPGYRLNARYRITQQTKTILQIQLNAGREAE